MTKADLDIHALLKDLIPPLIRKLRQLYAGYAFAIDPL